MDVIEIKNLDKSFKDVHAVNGLSFKVKRGELFAFLGENGAGKSTTINIMCGMLSKNGGKVFIDGLDIDDDLDAVKRKIGVVFQDCVLDKSLTVRENLEIKASFYGIMGGLFEKRLDALTKAFELKDILNKQLKKLSGGQRRRVDIARALIHEPQILILDEPTTGLDPQTRKRIWEVVRRLRKERGLTVLLTTHYMEEASEADYVLILDKGQISAEGTPLELKNTYTNDYITLYGVSEEKVKCLDVEYERIRDAFKLKIENTLVATELICKHPEVFKDYEITKGKMDDVFLNVTGKKLEG